MKGVISLAVVTAFLGLIPGIAPAGANPASSAQAARARAGLLEGAGRELSCVDVSSDDDRSRGAVATRTPVGGWSADYRPPDPTPLFQWASRGEWRRHRSATPSGSATIPLS